MPNTYAGLIEAKTIQTHVLVRVKPYERFVPWVSVSGYSNVFCTTVTQYPTLHNIKQIEAVKFILPTDATTIMLGQQQSISAVQTTESSWYWDLATSKLYIRPPSGINPNGAFVLGKFVLTFSTGIPGREFHDENNNPFFPYVLTVPNPQKTTQDPFFGLIPIGTGSVVLNARTGNLDRIFKEYQWDNADLEIKYGGEDLPYSEYQKVFTGKIQDKHWNDLTLELTCHDLNQDLNVEVPTQVFSSSLLATSITFRLGGLEAGAAITKSPGSISAQASLQFPVDKSIPTAYGYLVGITPILLAGSDTEAIVCLTSHPNAKIRSVYWDGEINITGKGQKFSWYADSTNRYIYLKRNTSTASIGTSGCLVSFLGKGGTGTAFLSNFADIVQDLVQQEAALTTLFDQDILARSRFLCNLYKPRIYLTNSVRLRDVLSNIMRSTLSYFYLSNAGKYCFDTWSPSLVGQIRLQEVAGDFVEITGETTSGRVYSTIIVEYGYCPPNQNTTSAQSIVKEPDGNFSISNSYRFVKIKRPEASAFCGRPNTFQVQSTYLADAVGAVTLGHRLGRISAQPNLCFSIKVPIRCMSKEVLDKLILIRSRLPSISSTVYAEIIGITRNLEKQEVDLNVDDQNVIGTQGFITQDETLNWSTSTTEQKLIMGYFTTDEGFADTSDPASWGTSRYY